MQGMEGEAVVDYRETRHNAADSVRSIRPKGKRCRLYRIIVFGRKESADFMNNNLNEKMRYMGKNSPWISSLRGIDATDWKCEYEGA